MTTRRAALALLPGSRPAAPRAGALSEREREVLSLVALGLPNKSVARRLQISEKTVKAHLTRIFATLGDAIAATLRIRMALLPEVDVRQGIGWGRVVVLAEEPRVEDGPGWWAARSASPRLRMRVSTHARCSASGPRPASSNGSSTFSIADSVGTRLKAWNTKPTWVRRNTVRASSSSACRAWPATQISPEVGSSRPAARFMNVDFPEPDGPITAVNWPGWMSTDTSSSARTTPLPSP